MKVFFSMSFRGDLALGRKIYSAIKELGHIHTSTCYEENTPQEYYTYSKSERAEHYKRVASELSDADVVILEASLPSLTIGQFVQQAIDSRIPTIVMHKPDSQPYFLDGMEDIEHRLITMEYTPQTIQESIIEGISYFSDAFETRFTLILPSSVSRHLDKISKTGKSKSEYIRELIVKDMEEKHL